MRVSGLRTIGSGSAALLLLAGLAAVPATGQSVTAVPHLDLTRAMGQWYEVARYPVKAERKCLGDVFSLFALAEKPGRFQVVDSCRTRAGLPEIRNGSGRSQDKTGGGRLRVTYVFPFSTKKWVLALDPDYGWALLGSPNHKLLWIVSRSKTMDPSVLAAIEAKAAEQGFDPSRLVVTPQSK